MRVEPSLGDATIRPVEKFTEIPEGFDASAAWRDPD